MTLSDKIIDWLTVRYLMMVLGSHIAEIFRFLDMRNTIKYMCSGRDLKKKNWNWLARKVLIYSWTLAINVESENYWITEAVIFVFCFLFRFFRWFWFHCHYMKRISQFAGWLPHITFVSICLLLDWHCATITFINGLSTNWNRNVFGNSGDVLFII